ncbi:hypothetical protein GSY69_03755 [Brevibacterium sp. 5221]|uniref:Uncharacterized protein n=1 Tax=Brevibacterium rongguiense TaxID=2695267 RepID=A0A6N9H5B5_9MICO|nr:hypothetical protein [Brevibacterium rongguiense]MYM19109.1 hypothetical protein [Brevibacterium rongguiense]
MDPAFERWRAAGGTWRVLNGAGAAEVRVELRTCDGGEPMGVLAVADAATCAFLAEHPEGPAD